MLVQDEALALTLDLLHAETEEEVQKIIDSNEFLKKETNWHPYGGLANNWSMCSNQSSEPIPALTEKIINSIDAMLMRECYMAGIDPEGPRAPKTMEEAAAQFFGPKVLGFEEGKVGKIYNDDARRKFAEQIKIVVTGSAKECNVLIIDEGEGQHPKKFPDTLLSLAKSNKMKIPFVQGKHNQGSTGAIVFCGPRKKGFQLIISRRCPKIAQFPQDNPWGMTLVRVQPPRNNEKSHYVEYFAPDKEVISFSADSLNANPGEYPEAYGEKWSSGTLVKLYNYQLPRKGWADKDLAEDLSRQLYSVALPFRIYDRKPGLKGHTHEKTFSGMEVRIKEDRMENIEGGYPNTELVPLPGMGNLQITYVPFKKGKGSSWIQDKAVFFTLNGQAHDSLSRSFFKRKSVKLDYLAKDLMVIVNFEKLSREAVSDLFMASRDRRFKNESSKIIEDTLENSLKDHKGLAELNHLRFQESVKEKVGDNKDLEQMLRNWIKTSPAIAKLLGFGGTISKPSPDKPKKAYEGRQFPSYLRPVKGLASTGVKECPINSYCKIIAETDVENQYLDRAVDPGKLYINSEKFKDHIGVKLWEGNVTFGISPPAGAKVGDKFSLQVGFEDVNRIDPLSISLSLIVTEAVEKRTHPPKPPQLKQSFTVPQIQRISRDRWEDQDPPMNERSGLYLKNSPNQDEGVIAYVNIDNVYLWSAIRSNRKPGTEEILKRQFELGLLIPALAYWKHLGEKDDSKDEKIAEFTMVISEVILDIAQYLGNLTPEEVELGIE
jgi:hypothetical protein